MTVRRLALAIALTLLSVLAVSASEMAGEAGAAGKQPACSLFLKKESIVETTGKEVLLTKPDPHSAVGAWQEGPRTACFATTPPSPGELGGGETVALWGVGYGVTAQGWNKIKSVESGPEPVEGTGPWTVTKANIRRQGYQAFFACTEAFAGAEWGTLCYLYVLTPRKNLFYLDIRPATTAQLTGLARTILGEHPKF